MEVQHAGVRLPAFDSLRHAEVIEWRRPPKPPGQTLLRSHIVTGKHVQPAQSSQRHVLGGPAADSLELTRIGRFIRRTNFDELPQLLNILKGDMSVVGPRPAIKSQSELIALRQANGALACRPGLTGLAQVSSYDGMTDVQKAVFDGEYARSVSLAVDLRIIVRTVTYLLKPPPRY